MSTLLVPVALIVSFLITAYFVRRLSVGPAGDNATDWKKVGIFFVVMLLGMVAREAYDAATNNRSVNWGSLAIPLLVSPLVFGIIHTGLDSLEINIPSLVLSFQNGFFWSQVFKGIQNSANGGGGGATATPTP